MLGTPLIAFSIGAATVCSSVSADAPGYTACTVTTGGAISGYCAIGSVRIAARPASTRNMEITAAKIGRSMKKRENMEVSSVRYALGADLASAGGAAPGAAGAPGVAPGAPAGAPPSLIGAPGRSFATPSTITASPGFKPLSTIHRFAPSCTTHSPSVTGRTPATSLPSLSFSAT